MRNRLNPDFYDAVKYDPHLKISAEERAEYISDVNKKSTRILLPIIRFILVLGIHILRFIKRILPFKVKSHGLLNKLGVWFMGNFISPQALGYIIRHFQYESALINFVADNCGSDKVERVDLMPTHVSQLGDTNGVNAIMLHDFNIYNHIIDTGMHDDVNVTDRIPLDKINFDALNLPEIDIEEQRKRWMNFDIETSAYIMVFFLVLFLSDEEGERAALSLQFDESLFASLSNMTGDDYFRCLCPMKYTHWLRYQFDVVKDLRWHMISIDYAYNQMMSIKKKQVSQGAEQQEVTRSTEEEAALA
ncbi:DUF6999 family protein [Pleionea sediminis]|uniref:DUF6999 family protein n=1 Tax=Pleionea sediminis TaxID=2569479 RepID=UPI001185125A|nr:hypothetical protein [Pleionea sediminis]